MVWKSLSPRDQWYLLATLYGRPASINDDAHARNRTAWNRFMAAELKADDRELLIKEGRLSAEDPIPFSAEELADVEKRFAERHRQEAHEAGTAEAAPQLPNLKRDRIDFSNVALNRRFLVKGFFFPCHAHGELGIADFSGARFFGADFSEATFSGGADFSGASFSDVTFSDFSDVTFSDAMFSGAKFSRQADFSGTTFSGRADFSGATFSQADFTGTKFFRKADFSGATFKKETSFVNAEMKGPTSFEDAEFKTVPPQFFGAKLHEGTVWRGVKWPPPPKDHEEAGRFVDAYERLKLEIDRLRKHEDELDFFALEFRSRRVMYGDWQPVSELRLLRRTIAIPPLKIPERTFTPRARKLFGRSFALPPFTIPAWTIRLFRPAPGLAIALYGWLSDYGRSYVRPLYGLLITIAAGVPFFWWHLSGFFRAVGHSFANTFGVLGFRRDLISTGVIADLPSWLKVLAASQTIAGIVLLFLFGLAIRNRFRMK